MKTKKPKIIGLLTGGGDCPGLNAAIRAVTKAALVHKIQVIGIERGFLGLYQNQLKFLQSQNVSGILSRGGTILRSSRFNPFKKREILEVVKKRIRHAGIEGLVVIGGDGSLGIAADCYKKLKIPAIGIPKTIDNDVYGTDYTIGFHTAVQTAVDAIDRLHTTAESHEFVMVVEVMGRHCGYLASYAGLASGADMVLIPEQKSSLDFIVKTLKNRLLKNKNSSIVVVAEDTTVSYKNKIVAETPSTKDEYGKIKLGGVGWKVRALLQKELGCETRCTVLGHVQRGGTPVAFDRILATRMGHKAVELILKNKWGQLIAYEKGEIVAKPLAIVRKGVKHLPLDFYKMTKTYFDA